MTPTKRTTILSPATKTTTTPVTDAQLKALIDQGIADVLGARDADRSQNGEDNHDSGMGVRRQAPLACKCTYPDFMKCKPLYFKGTEGVVELTQWFERMETVFRISNCTVENQIKFATCTLLGSALTCSLSSFITIAKRGSSSIFTFFNLTTGAELVLEAEELLLPLAEAEECSFIMLPFKVLALNVDFDFKIDLIVFGLKIGSAPVSFSSRGRGCYRLKIHPLNHNQLLKSQRQQMNGQLCFFVTYLRVLY
nr:hypothetical protein [Tanacetum cinerariifolium]